MREEDWVEYNLVCDPKNRACKYSWNLVIFISKLILENFNTSKKFV